MANTFALTDFTSRTLGTFIHQYSPFIFLSYRGVREFEDMRTYGVSDVLDIKIPGVRNIQTGLTLTPGGITDKTVAYTISDADIYSDIYEVDIRRIKMQVVGGRYAFMQDPNKNPDNAKEINPQAKVMIDDYIYPSYTGINGRLERTMAAKCAAVASYTPIDLPSKLGDVNSYADISSVTEMMDEFGFLAGSRYGIMNTRDEKRVSDSLQNTFVNSVNEPVTREARLSRGNPGNYMSSGRLARQNIYCSNSIPIQEASPQFTANPSSAGVTVSSISADGTQLTLTGLVASTVGVLTAGTKIALPNTKWLKKGPGLPSEFNCVVVVKEDVDSDVGGNATITLGMPLFATTEHANVNVLPVNTDPALVYPALRHNFFFVPMGIIANTVPLGDIHGADNGKYFNRMNKIYTHSYIQGVARNGTNDYIIRVLVPTLAIGDYIIDLPSAV